MKNRSNNKAIRGRHGDHAVSGGRIELSEFYLQIFERAPNGVLLFDSSVRMLRANSRACELSGYTESELLARHPFVLVHPSERRTARREIEAVLGGQKASTLRQRQIVRKDGSIAPVSVSGYAAVDDRGETVGLLIFLEDVTATRAAEDALRKSEERFALAMRGINEGLYDWNIAAGTTYLSPRWKSMLGYDENDHEIDASPEAWERLLAPGMQEKLDAQYAELEAGAHETYEIELQLRHKDGRWIDILSRAFPVFDERHKVVRLVGTHRDITERKRHEAELDRAAQVFENTHEAIAILTRDGVLETVNPAFAEITGYTVSEMLGQHVRVLRSNRMGEEFYQRMWASIRENDRWQGEVWNRRKDGAEFAIWLTINAVRDKNGVLVNYVSLFTDISALKQTQNRLDFLAHHDPLTGLPNRLTLTERIAALLEAAGQDGLTRALLFLDLDRFKTINDSLGHAAGDELLMLASERWRARLRDKDMLARIGGDEFVVLLDPAESQAHARALAHLLIADTSHPFALVGHREVYVGLSVGIASFAAERASPDELIRRADSALFTAKQAGGGVRYYSPAQTSAARARLDIEAGLRRALARGEFALQFQPQVRLADGRAMGAEALIRWRSPEGLVSPGDFIPLAEKTGLIVPIGDWVLEESCRRMKSWLDAGFDVSTIAVNLSSREFDLPDLHERIRSILDETGLAAEHLEIEITETTIMQQGVHAVRKLETLKALGVRIAVDDFGTGHSSLAYLKRFPIDVLKLDRAFIVDIPADSKSMEIAAAVIRLGHSLHVDVLAEGVETAEQADFLALAGCPTVQGFYFARPMWEPEWIAKLEQQGAAREGVRAAG